MTPLPLGLDLVHLAPCLELETNNFGSGSTRSVIFMRKEGFPNLIIFAWQYSPCVIQHLPSTGTARLVLADAGIDLFFMLHLTGLDKNVYTNTCRLSISYWHVLDGGLNENLWVSECIAMK